MADVIAGDVVRADVVGDFNGLDDLVHVFQFRLVSGGPIAPADALDDLAEIFEDIWALIDGLMSVLTAFRRLRGQIMPLGELLGEHVFSPVLLGTSVQSVSSTTVTGPVSFKTTTPRVILRKSYGPIAENQIDADGQLTAGAMADLAASGAVLLGPIVKTFGTWEYGYESPKALDFVVPNSVLVTSAPGTMSSRRIGQGS